MAILLDQGAQGTGDRNQRCAEVMRYRVEQRRLKFVGCLEEVGLMNAFGQAGSLNRQRNLVGKSLRGLPLLRREGCS